MEMDQKKSSGTRQRIAVGLLTTLFSIAIILGSHYPLVHALFLGVIFLMIWGSLNEFAVICQLKGFSIEKKASICFSFLYLLALTVFPLKPATMLLPIGFFVLSLFALFLLQFKRGSTPLSTLAATVFGLLYIAFPLASLYQINYLFPEHGPFWLLYLIIVVKLSDTVAFFVGSRMGRVPLAPIISPKKTVEGAVGGVVGSLAGSVLFHLFAPEIIGFEESIFLGLALGVIAELGDLSESILKRDAALKDSNKLPGLGGVLDIVDSLLFATPFLLLYLLL